MTRKEIERGIESYNKYRSPRATSKLLRLSSKELEVQIEGSFCRSCGMEEYFVDLVYELEEQGIGAEYLGFEETGEEEFIAKYRI